MLSLHTRIELLEKLGQYMLSDDEDWQEVKVRAKLSNMWFTPEHIDLAIRSIAEQFLQKTIMEQWVSRYNYATNPKKVGIVCAGNIPLVGFHDFMCGFLSGHDVMLKLSSKDEVLMKHLVAKLTEWAPEVAEHVQISDMLKGCDAYITTGSNNTARYFEQYFGQFPHIIRKNRTSVAILTGNETDEQLSLLGDDIFLHFGLGCRNVTQIYVPKDYNFEKLLAAFNKYSEYINHNKFKNNYDYHLALYLLNRVPYMTNELLLMVENEMPFSPVAVLHYQYYTDVAEVEEKLQSNDDIQCIVGAGHVAFGDAQRPGIADYADGVDTMEFLGRL